MGTPPSLRRSRRMHLTNLFYGRCRPAGRMDRYWFMCTGWAASFKIGSSPATARLRWPRARAPATICTTMLSSRLPHGLPEHEQHNTPNNASIQTNAAMLQTMFPLILAHYGVSKVFFVCHPRAPRLGVGIANPCGSASQPDLTMARRTRETPGVLDLPSRNQALGQTLACSLPPCNPWKC